MAGWNQNLIQKGWNFASEAHKSQLVPGSDWSYLNHIGNVSMEAMNSVAFGGVENPNLLVLCAILHDTIEDTEVTFEELETEFGGEVARGVLALSKNEALGTKREQMEDSLKRIKEQPKEVWMVKLCDRITNLQKPPYYWEKAKVATYKSEAQLILEELGSASLFLTERLTIKIEEYSQYE